MTAVTKNFILAAAALAISTLPPLFADTIFHTIRNRFNTVGIQTASDNYTGDVVFFLVVTTFLLTPWIAAFALRIKGISDWAAFIPLIALIACWLINQRERLAESAQLLSWVAFMGYACSAIGCAASERDDRRWLRMVWFPSMFFLIFFVATKWWFDVFFE
jgi:hypothetical protein